MRVMDMQNVIFMEDDLVALMQSVKAGLVKWVGHDSLDADVLILGKDFNEFLGEISEEVVHRSLLP